MSRRNQLITEANKTIMGLFQKYGVTHPSGVKKIIREQFTQQDLDAYKAALAQLHANGGI